MPKEKNHNYTHEDWKAFKKYFGLNNDSIATLVGLKKASVDNQTAKRVTELPKWAVLAIATWYEMINRQKR